MLLLSGLQNPLAFIVFILALTSAITFHECAHALIADRLGDPTPRMAGRITLNPLAHLDIFGTIMLFLVGFGWGKPVMINPQYFARPITDELLVALAGPASNLIQASVLGLIIRLIAPSTPIVAELLAVIVQINILLMCFNLIPIPPLDGSKMLRVFIGEEAFQTLEQFSVPLIIGLFFILQTTPFGNGLSTISNHLTSWIING